MILLVIVEENIIAVTVIFIGVNGLSVWVISGAQLETLLEISSLHPTFQSLETQQPITAAYLGRDWL